MLGGRGFFFDGFEINVDDVSFVQSGQDLVLLCVIVIFCPALLKHDHTLEGKALKSANVNSNLCT